MKNSKKRLFFSSISFKMIFLSLFFASFLFIGKDIFAGGVTVGNGGDQVVIGMNIPGAYENQNTLLNFGEKIINEIVNDQNPFINKVKRDGNCKSHTARELFVQKFLPLESKNQNNSLRGYLLVELQDCKLPNRIKGQTPYGGSDFWDLYGVDELPTY